MGVAPHALEHPPSSKTGDEKKRIAFLEQRGNLVAVAHAGHIGIGEYLRIGRHIGVLESHNRKNSVIRLEFEQHNADLTSPRTAVSPDSLIRPFGSDDWDVFQNLFFGKRRVQIGNIRQDGVSAAAFVQPFNGRRTLFIGQPGGGKTTAMQVSLGLWDNARERYCRANNLTRKQARLSGILFLDLKNDALPGHHDEDGKPRPNLFECLERPPSVFGPEDIVCRMEDVPTTLLAQCLDPLSNSQKEWLSLYVHGDDDYHAVRTLLHETEEVWATEFSAWASGGKVLKNKLQSLVTLRSKLGALLQPPLFREDKASTWHNIHRRLYEGECVIVKLREYNPAQQNILYNLLIRHLINIQTKTVEQGRKCYPITVAMPEAHKMRLCGDTTEFLFREGRAYDIGALYDSQDPSDYSDKVLGCASSVLVFNLQAQALKTAVDKWPCLKVYEKEIPRLKPGQAFLVSNGIAIPIGFKELGRVRGTGENG